MSAIARETRFFEHDIVAGEIVIPVHRFSFPPCDITNPGSVLVHEYELRIFRKGTDGSTYLVYRPTGFDPLKGLKFFLDTQLYYQPKGLYTGRIYHNILLNNLPQITRIRPDFTFRLGRRGYTMPGYVSFRPSYNTTLDENPSPTPE